MNELKASHGELVVNIYLRVRKRLNGVLHGLMVVYDGLGQLSDEVFVKLAMTSWICPWGRKPQERQKIAKPEVGSAVVYISLFILRSLVSLLFFLGKLRCLRYRWRQFLRPLNRGFFKVIWKNPPIHPIASFQHFSSQNEHVTRFIAPVRSNTQLLMEAKM